MKILLIALVAFASVKSMAYSGHSAIDVELNLDAAQIFIEHSYPSTMLLGYEVVRLRVEKALIAPIAGLDTSYPTVNGDMELSFSTVAVYHTVYSRVLLNPDDNKVYTYGNQCGQDEARLIGTSVNGQLKLEKGITLTGVLRTQKAENTILRRDAYVEFGPQRSCN